MSYYVGCSRCFTLCNQSYVTKEYYEELKLCCGQFAKA